jgi:hypothetical protein
LGGKAFYFTHQGNIKGNTMYIYYVLRGMRGDQATEVEGDIDEAAFPNIKLDDGPALISQIVKLTSSDGWVEWTECDLTDDFFNREDNYIFFEGRWIRRSNAPYYKNRTY